MTRLLLLLVVLSDSACGTVKVAPVTVQPIHITVDVNLHEPLGDPAGPHPPANN